MKELTVMKKAAGRNKYSRWIFDLHFVNNNETLNEMETIN
jgi:hypothetical protein